MSYRFRTRYGVSRGEVEEFVEEFESVQRFTRRYSNEGSRFWNARDVCMFFKWLRLVKHLDLTPDEFIDLLAEKRSKLSRKERLWGLDLVLAFSRDNPDFKDRAVSYKRSKLFLPLKSFCGANEVVLTSDRGFFGRCKPRKFEERAFTVAFAKKVLQLLSPRNRAVSMTMLQSGQSIRQVLVDVNRQADYIFNEIDAGKERIRLDFNGRKENNFRYFSFISQDAIQEIVKWRFIREKWLAGKTSRWLFITRKLKPLAIGSFQSNFKEMMWRHRIWKGPYSVRTHMFRKIFEQEASPPDRGISRLHVAFMMGHKSGKDLVSSLDAVGGTYDQSPWIYDAVEKEYAKLERFLNIYSSRTVQLPDEKMREFYEFWNQPKVRQFLVEAMREKGIDI